jgi:hypothetical protein
MKPRFGQSVVPSPCSCNVSPETSLGVRTAISFSRSRLPPFPMLGQLPTDEKHDRREHDRREHGDDGDQLGARTYIDATDAS